MKTVKFGNLEIGKEHRIAAVVHLRSDLEKLPGIVREKTADLFELRADRLRVEGREAVRESLNRIKEQGMPVIATVREGEGYVFKEGERLKLIKELIPEVDAVDIEMKTGIRDEVIKFAKDKGKAVIISEHNLAETPPESEIEKMFSECRMAGADVIKMAFSPNKEEDVSRLMCFLLLKQKEIPLVCISLGDKGNISRSVGPIIGSCLSYGYIEKAVAPGQSSLVSLKEEREKYKNIMQKQSLQNNPCLKS